MHVSVSGHACAYVCVGACVSGCVCLIELSMPYTCNVHVSMSVHACTCVCVWGVGQIGGSVLSR